MYLLINSYKRNSKLGNQMNSLLQWTLIISGIFLVYALMFYAGYKIYTPRQYTNYITNDINTGSLRSSTSSSSH